MEKYLDFEKPIIELENKLNELRSMSSDQKLDMSTEIKSIQVKMTELVDTTYRALTPWQKILLSRHPNRPHFKDYLPLIFKDFLELHGDRCFKDDLAIIGGIGKLQNHTVMVIGQEKGRTTKERISHNFGMPHPEGYRKACRLMKLAEQFQIPVILFIDTPGAFPGIEAEKRGQSEAIANNLITMVGLNIPTISVVIGEGGSGGALAIGITDRILMLEFAVYSVISPESCASILWSDPSKCDISAAALKMGAPNLKDLTVIDEIIPEPLGGAHRDLNKMAKSIEQALMLNLEKLITISNDQLLDSRYNKYRGMGQFEELLENTESAL
jgi:acetyl-CoA carboxylase carboxyl transferase subunit alpha